MPALPSPAQLLPAASLHPWRDVAASQSSLGLLPARGMAPLWSGQGASPGLSSCHKVSHWCPHCQDMAGSSWAGLFLEGIDKLPAPAFTRAPGNFKPNFVVLQELILPCKAGLSSLALLLLMPWPWFSQQAQASPPITPPKLQELL